jgi:ABC-type Fe3+ transport system permease subunit
LFLTLGGWEMIPFGIFTYYIAGSHSQAAALGVILIALCAVTLYVVNRLAGAKVGGLFG